MKSAISLLMVLSASALAVAAPPRLEGYLVLLSPGDERQFAPAAEALAEMHGGRVVEFDPARLDELLPPLRAAAPRFVVFVLPPEQIDIDLVHATLELATKVDEDLFVDFEYGFVTGRDGAAALRFVERMRAAWDREPGNRLGMMGTWEGAALPAAERQSAAAALGLDTTVRLILMSAGEEARRAATQKALGDLGGHDLLMFFSHGYPDQMVGCFRGRDLRAWNPQLGPAVLFNCACYNGAPGRWFEPGAGGMMERPGAGAGESVALALLDSGLVGYFAGVDPWHGPLNNKVFQYVADDGLSCGAAAKRMYDRLTLEFGGERIRFGPTHERKFTGEGQENRRVQTAAMIFYGDPAFVPRAGRASKLISHELRTSDSGRREIAIRVKPQVAGAPAMLDFMLPQARWMDYHSVRSANVFKELGIELYYVVALPSDWADLEALEVASATSGAVKLNAGAPQTMIEMTPEGRTLHVRVPLGPMYGGNQVLQLATQGADFVLTEKAARVIR